MSPRDIKCTLNPAMPVGFALGLPVNEPRSSSSLKRDCIGFLSGTLENTYLRVNTSKHEIPTPASKPAFPLVPFFPAVIRCHDLTSDACHFSPGLRPWRAASRLVHPTCTDTRAPLRKSFLRLRGVIMRPPDIWPPLSAAPHLTSASPGSS